MSGHCTTQACQPNTLEWRSPGAHLQFEVIVVVLVLFLAFWLWVVRNTYDTPKFKRRKDDWRS